MSKNRTTLREYLALVAKGKVEPRYSKYNSKRCHGYASEKEYHRSQELKLLLRGGFISDLREQVRFLLIPSQVNGEGTKERPVHYIADFVYIDNATGKTVVEDTKGFKTPEYIIKRKLMLFIHGITIKEI